MQDIKPMPRYKYKKKKNTSVCVIHMHMSLTGLPGGMNKFDSKDLILFLPALS